MKTLAKFCSDRVAIPEGQPGVVFRATRRAAVRVLFFSRPPARYLTAMNGSFDLCRLVFRLLRSLGVLGFYRCLVTPRAQLLERVMRLEAEIRRLEARNDGIETTLIETQCQLSIIRYDRARADSWKDKDL